MSVRSPAITQLPRPKSAYNWLRLAFALALGGALSLLLAPKTALITATVLFAMASCALGPWYTFFAESSKLAARLPISPRACLQAAHRSARPLALEGFAASLVCLTPLAIATPEEGWRALHSMFALAAVTLLSPAAAVFGGAALISPKTVAVLKDFGGSEGAAPTGMVPLATSLAGLSAAALVWISALQPPLIALLSSLLFFLLSLLLYGAAGLVAKSSYRHAWATLDALDQNRLAHVDRIGATQLDRILVLAPLGKQSLARKWAEKDLKILHRRFPLDDWMLRGALLTLLIRAPLLARNSGFSALLPLDVWLIAALTAACASIALRAIRISKPPVEQYGEVPETAGVSGVHRSSDPHRSRAKRAILSGVCALFALTCITAAVLAYAVASPKS